MGETEGVRLQKVLSQAGIASRRAAEKLILEGRVEVDGQVVTDATATAPGDTLDVVLARGRAVVRVQRTVPADADDA